MLFLEKFCSRAAVGARVPEEAWKPQVTLRHKPPVVTQGYSAIKERFSSAVAAQNAALLRATAGSGPPPCPPGTDMARCGGRLPEWCLSRGY